MQFLLGLVTLNRKWSALLGCSCSSRARQLQLVSAACCSHCQLLLVNAAVHLCMHAFAGRFLMYVFHKPICVEPGICYGILGYSKQTWERLLTTVSTFFQVVMGLFIITRYLVRLVHALIIIIFLNVFFLFVKHASHEIFKLKCKEDKTNAFVCFIICENVLPQKKIGINI